MVNEDLHNIPSLYDTRELNWLELDSIPDKVFNPLTDYKIGVERPDEIEELVSLMADPDYIHFTAKTLLNVELPPYQCVIIDALWKHRLPMLIGTRGAAKSTILGIYCVLRMILHPGCKIVIVGNGLRQSRQVFDYMKTIWDKAPILRDIAGKSKTAGPRREVDRFQFEIGDSYCYGIPLGDGCLSYQSYLVSQNEFIQIGKLFNKNEKINIKQQIKEKNHIYADNDFVISDEKYSNGIAKTKIINTKRGYSFEGTFNHKMKVLRKDTIEWCRSDEMKIGDRILINRKEKWHNGKEDYLNYNDAYAYGAILGDGNYTQKYEIGFATEDVEMIDYLNLAKNSLNKNFVPRGDKHHWSMYGINQVEHWLDCWEIERTKTINKTLSKVALSLPRELMTACLQGLYDTDGGCQVKDDPRGGTSIAVSFWNTSEQLIDQMHFILLHYGIIATKDSRQRKNKNWNKEFSLRITGKDVRIFADKIGFRLIRKQKLLLEGLSNKTRDISNTDEVPFIKEEMARIAKDHCAKFKSIKQSQYPTYANELSEKRILKKKVITRDYIDAFIERYGSCQDPFINQLIDLANPDIYYDEIISIEDGECETYDIHVPKTHEYCANGFFSHNSTIRGLRANYIIADEFASINEEIFNLVVQGFAVVSSDPIQKIKRKANLRTMKKQGHWNQAIQDTVNQESEGNQIIYSGTASWAFNHFYKYFKKWHAIICSKGDHRKLSELLGTNDANMKGFNWRDYAILRIPYNYVPEGLLDEGILAQAKATLTKNQFLMEYGAVFMTDSDGFYRRSIIEAATTNKPILVSSGKTVQFSAVRYGDAKRFYVIGIDPAADQDNAAIVILEIHDDHRRIVHCWTTNQKKYNDLKKEMSKQGMDLGDDYYRYIARKIRGFMKIFNTEHIIMDKHGGGTAIAEALGNKKECAELGEIPVYVIIDPEEPKPTDAESGAHILQLIAPTQDINSEANHGMLKDLQDKVLLFPLFDSIELAKSIELDHLNNIQFDTYEDLVNEIEELKQEMTSIIPSQSSILGKETFDTPSIKGEGHRKGRLRKDRFSALLYANYYLRDRGKKEAYVLTYKPTGGTKDSRVKTAHPTGQMYYGLGIAAFDKAKCQGWLSGNAFRYLKH